MLFVTNMLRNENFFISQKILHEKIAKHITHLQDEV